jgi:hypothetical protein
LGLPTFPPRAIGPSPWVQTASLKISQPSDPLEVEAERSADRVLRMPDDLSEPSGRTEGALVQRACAACEAEDSIGSVQRKVLSSHSQGGPLAHGAPNAVSAALGSPSTGLDASTRSFFEPRLGFDFAGVRVHANPEANAGARAIHARAFTFGRDMVFGAEQYSPHSAEGLRLLAHELSHVVQQGAAPRLDAHPEASQGPDAAVHAPLVMRQHIDVQCHESGRYPGNFEHAIIEDDYIVNINPSGAIEYAIPGSGPAGGTGYADIVNLGTYAIYEIKTYLGAPQGVFEAGRYRDAAVVCDAAAPWHVGNDYPAHVIPVDAQRELVVQQYPQFPGVVVYYWRLRRLVPIPEVRRQEQTDKERDRNQRTAPQRQLQPEPVLARIARFIKQVLEAADDAEAAATRFVREHPEVRDYILATAVALVVGTIIEDVLTAGAGILDDIATLRIAYALWRVARLAG